MTLWICLKVALSQRAFYCFMFCPFGSSEITFDVRWLSHCLHVNFIPSCTAFLCWARWLFEFAWRSHCLKGYFTPPCFALSCLARSPLTLDDCHIACTWILFLHVLPFCVEQDDSLKLIDGRIACKDIWLLHLLPFYVGWDFPLKLLHCHIASKGIWLLHVLPF